MPAANNNLTAVLFMSHFPLIISIFCYVSLGLLISFPGSRGCIIFPRWLAASAVHLSSLPFIALSLQGSAITGFHAGPAGGRFPGWLRKRRNTVHNNHRLQAGKNIAATDSPGPMDSAHPSGSRQSGIVQKVLRQFVPLHSRAHCKRTSAQVPR